MLPIEMNPIARGARRSMIISQPSSRPWNLDENYPWSGNKVEIDLLPPDQAHTRDGSTIQLHRRCGTKSLDFTNANETTDTRGIDIGSIYETGIGSSASITTEQCTGISSPVQPARKPSKRSIIGSISKKFGLSSRNAGGAAAATNNTTTDLEDTTLKSTTTTLPASRSPIPGRISSATTTDHHTSHRAGDRYPTSALTPPAATFNIDDVRSFFSDNSSERERTASFRKRLTTQFKSHHSHNRDRESGVKSKNAARAANGRGSTDQQDGVGNSTIYDAGSMTMHGAATLGGEGAMSSAANHLDGAVGMSKTEFHLKRFGEKLRVLLAKGGELLMRGMSVRDGKGI
jgi:hypothetical protein